MSANLRTQNVATTVRSRPRLAGLLACAIGASWSCFVAAGVSGLDPNDQALFEERVYIVQMAEPAALDYTGRPGGVAATRPRDGERFDARSGNVRAYSRELTDTHDATLQSIGAYDRKLYSYRYTFNGFAARLTPIQAQKLRSRKNVVNVWEDSVRYLYTNDSPVFLGLFDAGSGLVSGRDLKGEDIVIGVIDSGITPEHPSFSDTREANRPRLCKSDWAQNSLLGIWLCMRFKNRADTLTYDPPAEWNGQCESGDRFAADLCNNKIIGARYYLDGFLESHALDANEFMSPRDADGHGTHIASTAAGNEVRATLAGTDIDSHQRHGAPCAHRCLQGVLAGARADSRQLQHVRPATCYRGCGRRRRRYHQLFGRQHGYQYQRSGRPRIAGRVRCRRAERRRGG